MKTNEERMKEIVKLESEVYFSRTKEGETPENILKVLKRIQRLVETDVRALERITSR